MRRTASLTISLLALLTLASGMTVPNANALSPARVLTEPSFSNGAGDGLLRWATVGQQTMIKTTLFNTLDELQPFVVILQVRDSNDVTTYIAWQSGILDPLGNSTIGVLWSPKEKSTYDVSAYAVSDFTATHILSVGIKSEIVVR